MGCHQDHLMQAAESASPSQAGIPIDPAYSINRLLLSEGISAKQAVNMCLGVLDAGSRNSSKHTAVVLGVMLGLVATGCTAALAFVVYTRPEIVAERLPALFGRRRGTGLDAVDYTELQQPAERETLIHG